MIGSFWLFFLVWLRNSIFVFIVYRLMKEFYWRLVDFSYIGVKDNGKYDNE